VSLFPEDRTILDLCAGGGAWSEPYAQAGYRVVRVEKADGGDVRLWPSKPSDHARLPREFDDIEEWIGRVHGILAAPVCTVFSGSGACRRRTDDDIRDGLALADACLRLACVLRPKWWAMENPVGKLRKWIGPPVYSFDPCDFGDPYTKKTLLWGDFREPVKTPVEPIKVCSQGSWLMQLGGKSARTKSLRSVTPCGFARAFFEANP
jgi:hypothetical protein